MLQKGRTMSLTLCYFASHYPLSPIINHNTARHLKKIPNYVSTNEGCTASVYIDGGNYCKDEL